jgi:hypothetical protein
MINRKYKFCILGQLKPNHIVFRRHLK